MKISDITVYKVKPRWIFVKISTDEGIDGWGEMISGTKTETVVAGAYEIGNRLIGRNPFEIERLFQECIAPSSVVAPSMGRLFPDWKWRCGISKEKPLTSLSMNY